MIRGIYILTLLLLTGCGMTKNIKSHKPAENPAPVIKIPFDDVDTNKDNIIDRVEYISEVDTVYTDTPTYIFLYIMISVITVTVLLALMSRRNN